MPKGATNPTPTPEAEDVPAWGQYADLADLAETFGEKLESIEGEVVLLRSVTFTQREVANLEPFTDENPEDGSTLKTVAILSVSFSDAPDSVEKFYTFSTPLIDRLRVIDGKEGALPAVSRFERKSFDGGRKRVWSIVPANARRR
jgi:hypothetical protein